MRIFSGWLAAMAITIGLAGAVEAESIKIGVGGPFTGPNAAFGEQFWRGAELAAQEINRTGGIHGTLIELVKGDDGCEPKQALAVANRFVDSDRVKMVLGHFCSSSTMPASEVYADAGLLSVTPASTNPMVTERNLPTVFRTCGRDDQQGKVAAEFIVKRLQAKKIAVVHDKTTYGQGLATAMRDQLHQLGLQEILFEGITQGEKDFNALVTKMKSVEADLLYFGGLHGEAGPIVRQMREQGVQIPFVSGDGIVSQEMVVSAGGPQFLAGVYMTFGSDPRKLAEGKEVVERLRQVGYEPEGYTLYSYATIQAMVAAVKATGTTDGAKLAEWLHHNTVQTVMGPKAWDDKGDLKSSDYVIYQWNNQGQYTQLP